MQLLAIKWRDAKLKTVDCPVAGCQGKWTEKKSKVDTAYQAQVEAARDYWMEREKNDGSGAGAGEEGKSGVEIIELDL